MPLPRPATATLLALSLAATGPAAAGDDEVIADLGTLPPAVRRAADEASPGATWSGARREVDHDRATYEIEGTASSGQRVEVEVEVDAAGARVEKLELRPGGSPAAAPISHPAPPRDERSYLWPIALGVLAVFGFILKAIFADAFEAIGVMIARKLGAEHVGKAIEQRIARGRSPTPAAGDPAPPGPEPRSD